MLFWFDKCDFAQIFEAFWMSMNVFHNKEGVIVWVNPFEGTSWVTDLDLYAKITGLYY